MVMKGLWLWVAAGLVVALGGVQSNCKIHTNPHPEEKLRKAPTNPEDMIKKIIGCVNTAVHKSKTSEPSRTSILLREKETLKALITKVAQRGTLKAETVKQSCKQDTWHAFAEVDDYHVSVLIVSKIKPQNPYESPLREDVSTAASRIANAIEKDMSKLVENPKVWQMWDQVLNDSVDVSLGVYITESPDGLLLGTMEKAVLVAGYKTSSNALKSGTWRQFGWIPMQEARKTLHASKMSRASSKYKLAVQSMPDVVAEASVEYKQGAVLDGPLLDVVDDTVSKMADNLDQYISKDKSQKSREYYIRYYQMEKSGGNGMKSMIGNKLKEKWLIQLELKAVKQNFE